MVDNTRIVFVSLLSELEQFGKVRDRLSCMFIYKEDILE